MAISKTQIDKLGDRLRKGEAGEDDLRLLAEYRSSFAEASEAVVSALRRDLGLAPTARLAKSTASIVDKLRRESARLTQIQDIAGCRVIVKDLREQDRVVEQIRGLFERVHVIDRREHPSNGYRAVHAVVTHGGQAVEIQVRTEWQHEWAELSEKLADQIDPAIKYGGGDEVVQGPLMGLSEAVAQSEALELRVAELGLPPETLIGEMPDELREGFHENAAMLERHLGALRKFTDRLAGEKTDDIPD